MAKRAKKDRIEQFRRDLAVLRKKRKNDEIAGMLGIDPPRLSSYGTGAKNPGEDFINKFYRQFGDEIEEIKKQAYDHGGTGNNDHPPFEAEEPPQEFSSRNAQDELIRLLKEERERLWSNFSKIVDSNQSLANSIERDSKSRDRDSIGRLILIKTNANLESRLGPQVRRPRKPSKPE